MTYTFAGGPFDGFTFEPLRKTEHAVTLYGPQKVSALFPGYIFTLDGRAT